MPPSQRGRSAGRGHGGVVMNNAEPGGLPARAPVMFSGIDGDEICSGADKQLEETELQPHTEQPLYTTLINNSVQDGNSLLTC